MHCTVTFFTVADRQRQWREEAVQPAYSTLTDKLSGYTGRIMGYTLYVVSYEQSSDGQWIIEMAMDKKSGTYRNIVIVTTTEEPQLILDSEVKMYGRCTGSYTVVPEITSLSPVSSVGKGVSRLTGIIFFW